MAIVTFTFDTENEDQNRDLMMMLQAKSLHLLVWELQNNHLRDIIQGRGIKFSGEKAIRDLLEGETDAAKIPGDTMAQIISITIGLLADDHYINLDILE